MSTEPKSMEDKILLTWGVMEEALGKAADILLQLTGDHGLPIYPSDNSLVDYIALIMAGKVYRSSPSFIPTNFWENLVTDSEIATAIDQVLTKLEEASPRWWDFVNEYNVTGQGELIWPCIRPFEGGVLQLLGYDSAQIIVG